MINKWGWTQLKERLYDVLETETYYAGRVLIPSVSASVKKDIKLKGEPNVSWVSLDL